jgi:hypothetical protein
VVIWVVCGSERLKVLPGAAPAQAGDQVPKQFPILLFSHGLAGNRLMYSSFCVKLASYGFIVLAIEHADGLAAATRMAGARCDCSSPACCCLKLCAIVDRMAPESCHCAGCCAGTMLDVVWLVPDVLNAHAADGCCTVDGAAMNTGRGVTCTVWRKCLRACACCRRSMPKGQMSRRLPVELQALPRAQAAFSPISNRGWTWAVLPLRDTAMGPELRLRLVPSLMVSTAQFCLIPGTLQSRLQLDAPTGQALAVIAHSLS